jgi:pentatricopeptide repeat protein
MHYLVLYTDNIPPSSQIYNVAIDGARILRSPELCEKLFKELIERGIPVIQPFP